MIIKYIMTIYIFYRITHPYYPELNYIGSTKNFYMRKIKHKSECYNEKSRSYNKKLYKFIRENNIDWNGIEFKILMECNTNIHFKLENMFINQYDSIENGLNDRLAFNPDCKKIYRMKNKEYYEKYKIKHQDKLNEYKKKYYIENKEKLNEKQKNIELKIQKK